MNKITIFTDGSSRGNPGPGGWGAIAVYPNAAGDMKVDELGGREENTTNNRMEMMAAISALHHFEGYYDSFDEYVFNIHTDSSYLINGITKWVKGWAQNNWITKAKEQVINKDLWQLLVDAVGDKNVKWTYIAGHSGIPGNERCDIIATSFADNEHIDLYKGDLSSYKVDITNFEGHLLGPFDKLRASKKKSSNKERSQAKAYSYVSMVGGKLFFDKTWKECEARVKGVKGTKYKKALSEIEEKEIAKEFSKK
jgi:ribonuclease HI